MAPAPKKRQRTAAITPGGAIRASTNGSRPPVPAVCTSSTLDTGAGIKTTHACVQMLAAWDNVHGALGRDAQWHGRAYGNHSHLDFDSLGRDLFNDIYKIIDIGKGVGLAAEVRFSALKYLASIGKTMVHASKPNQYKIITAIRGKCIDEQFMTNGMIRIAQSMSEYERGQVCREVGPHNQSTLSDLRLVDELKDDDDDTTALLTGITFVIAWFIPGEQVPDIPENVSHSPQASIRGFEDLSRLAASPSPPLGKTTMMSTATQTEHLHHQSEGASQTAFQQRYTTTDSSTQTDESIVAQGSSLLAKKKKKKRRRSWDDGADMESIPLFKVEVLDDGSEDVPGHREQEESPPSGEAVDENTIVVQV